MQGIEIRLKLKGIAEAFEKSMNLEIIKLSMTGPNELMIMLSNACMIFLHLIFKEEELK